MGSILSLSSETATAGCAVCGNPEVMLDEVSDAGTLHLAECGRCKHRWTWRGPVVVGPRSPNNRGMTAVRRGGVVSSEAKVTTAA